MRARADASVVVRRPLGDRVALVFPRLLPLALRIALRLRPGSAARRRALAYGLRRTFAAINRRDFDVVLLGMEPEAEIEFRGVEATVIARATTAATDSARSGPSGCATGSRSPTGSRP